MPVDERRRSALREQVTAAWGEEAADTLFDLVAPDGHEPATKQDLERGFESLDQRFAQIDERFAQVDQRFAQVDQRFERLEARMDQRFAEFGQRFEQRIADAITTQTRTLVFSQLAALVAIAALAFGLR